MSAIMIGTTAPLASVKQNPPKVDQFQQQKRHPTNTQLVCYGNRCINTILGLEMGY